MTDLSRKTRDQLLGTLDAVLKELREVRATSKAETGYLGFELAESTLLACRGAVESAREVGQLVHTLKKAAGALRVTGGSDVAPAVQRARTTLETLWTALELTG